MSDGGGEASKADNSSLNNNGKLQYYNDNAINR